MDSLSLQVNPRTYVNRQIEEIKNDRKDLRDELKALKDVPQQLVRLFDDY